MSIDSEHRPAPLPPITPGSEFPGATAVEKEIATLRFGNGSPAPTSADDEDDPVQGSRRTAEVLRALFPEGLTLKSDDDFAFFHLLSRLVGTVALFAETGMGQPAPLREIAKLTALIEAVLPSAKVR